MSAPASISSDPSSVGQRTFFGHPIGLANLFFTEMWERFSYYGMRALLLPFLVLSVSQGGFGIDDRTANAIYGLYTASVYVLNIGGGWLADRIFGAQRAVLLGGIAIAIGHIVLGFAPDTTVFFVGLVIIVLGTWMLKPNISAMVAQIYPRGSPRLDSGFTLFYMGINLGAFLGPIVTGWLRLHYGWHWGFGSAAIGMMLGVAQFTWMRHQLGDAGREPANEAGRADLGQMLRWGIGVVAVVAVLVALFLTGIVNIGPLALNASFTYLISAIVIAYFGYLLFFAHLTPLEKKRVLLLFVLFASSACFWSGFEQAGSSLNLFAVRYTQLKYSWFELPSEWFQSLNSLFILMFAPVFAGLWVALSKRMLNPSTPVKFMFGLIGMAGGFLVMFFAAGYVAAGQIVGPQWLTMVYLLHTFGELALAPIGMSASSQLVPARFVGQSLGVWMLGLSLGNLMASKMAGNFDPNNVGAMPGQYLQIVWFGLLSAAAVWLAGSLIRNWIRKSETATA